MSRHILDLCDREVRIRRHVESLNPKTDPRYPDAFGELTQVQATLRGLEEQGEVRWNGDRWTLRR